MNHKITTAPDDAPGLAPAEGRSIYLVRHGVTEWNKSFRYQGITDVPLSDEGREQARLAGKRLAKIRAGAVISSPLKRSLETAEIIAAATDAPEVEIWDELCEVNFGAWEGLTVREIVGQFGFELFDRWRSSQISVAATNGEDPASVLARAKNAAERIASLKYENTIVVAHGAIFRALMLCLLEIPLSNVFWRMRMDNCSITKVSADKRGKLSASFFNDVTHLNIPEESIGILPL
jgi:alpha-ribazole phosphatase/probable phosphoglycerate mutase